MLLIVVTNRKRSLIQPKMLELAKSIECEVLRIYIQDVQYLLMKGKLLEMALKVINQFNSGDNNNDIDCEVNKLNLKNYENS